MNLKAAAQSLDVHYQTAYKWVRSGDLAAVRIGARYHVSDAAITQFMATRRAVLSEAAVSTPGRRVSDFTQQDVLEELAAIATDPIVAISSVVTLAARRGAQVLGDMCLVVRMDENGLVTNSAVDHPEPDRAAFVSAALDATHDRQTIVRGLASAASWAGRPVRVPHVSQDRLWASVRPELRQYLAQYSICSLLSVPIRAAGTTTGFVVFTRDSASHPYTTSDEEFAARMGTRIGSLFETAREIELAWQIRGDLAHGLRAQIARRGTRGPPTRGELDQLFRDLPVSAELPVAVLDANCRCLTANETFLRGSGHSLDAVVGNTFESFTHPDDRATERANFAHLVSGELDYLDTHARRVFADGTHLGYASHQVAVRDPDATLQYLITVDRPIHTPTDVPSAISILPSRTEELPTLTSVEPVFAPTWRSG